MQSYAGGVTPCSICKPHHSGAAEALQAIHGCELLIDTCPPPGFMGMVSKEGSPFLGKRKPLMGLSFQSDGGGIIPCIKFNFFLSSDSMLEKFGATIC